MEFSESRREKLQATRAVPTNQPTRPEITTNWGRYTASQPTIAECTMIDTKRECKHGSERVCWKTPLSCWTSWQGSGKPARSSEEKVLPRKWERLRGVAR